MKESEKKLIRALILEQIVAADDDASQVQQGKDNVETLIPLSPGQIDKISDTISKRFLNNIFNTVKTALGKAYYDDNLDKLYKDVRLRKSLEADFKTYVSKVINVAAKQPTGQGEPGVGVNKANIEQE